MSTFLNGDVCLNVISFLQPSDVMRLSCTSAFLYEVVSFNPDDVWGSHFCRKYPHIPPDFLYRFSVKIPNEVDRSIALLRAFLQGFPRSTMAITLPNEGTATSIHRIIFNETLWILTVRTQHSRESLAIGITMRCKDQGYLALDNAERRHIGRIEMRLKGDPHVPSIPLCDGHFHTGFERMIELPRDILRRIGVEDSMVKRKKKHKDAVEADQSSKRIALHLSVMESAVVNRSTFESLHLLPENEAGTGDVGAEDDTHEDDEEDTSARRGDTDDDDDDDTATSHHTGDDEGDTAAKDATSDKASDDDADDGDEDFSVHHGLNHVARYFPGRGRNSKPTADTLVAKYEHEGNTIIRTLLHPVRSPFVLRDSVFVSFRVFLISEESIGAATGLSITSECFTMSLLLQDKLAVLMNAAESRWGALKGGAGSYFTPSAVGSGVPFVSSSASGPVGFPPVERMIPLKPSTLAEEVESPTSWVTVFAFVASPFLKKGKEPTVFVKAYTGGAMLSCGQIQLHSKPLDMIRAVIVASKLLSDRIAVGVLQPNGSVEVLSETRPVEVHPRDTIVVHPGPAGTMLQDLNELKSPTTLQLLLKPRCDISSHPNARILVLSKSIDMAVSQNLIGSEICKALHIQEAFVQIAWKVGPNDYQPVPKNELLAYLHYLTARYQGPFCRHVEMQYFIEPNSLAKKVADVGPTTEVVAKQLDPVPAPAPKKSVLGTRSALEIEREKLRREKEIEERRTKEEAQRRAILEKDRITKPQEKSDALKQFQADHQPSSSHKKTALQVEQENAQRAREQQEREKKNADAHYAELMKQKRLNEEAKKKALQLFKAEHGGGGATTPPPAPVTSSVATTSPPPPVTSHLYTLVVRLPTGQTLQQDYPPTTLMKEVFGWASHALAGAAVILISYPKRYDVDGYGSKTLQELFEGNTRLAFSCNIVK